MSHFKDLNLNYLDARSELLYTPELFEQYYVDFGNRSKKILMPDKYIVYGAKGSGKTAIGAFLELKSKKDPSFFVKLDEFDEFNFEQIQEGNQEKDPTNNISRWKLLLSLRLLSLMIEDEQLVYDNYQLKVLSDDFVKFGLLPSDNVSILAKETLCNDISVKFDFFVQLSRNSKRTKEIKLKTPSQLSDAINKNWQNLKFTGNKYILVLDGLDHILRTGNNKAHTISELIRSVKAINESLYKFSIDAKIILLLRDDMLRIISDPDLSKRLNDNGVFLDWYQGISFKKHFESDLFNIVKKRAEVAGFTGGIKEIWKTWFPKHIYGRYSTLFFLERTRYLPRDLISFLKILQNNSENIPFDENTIKNCEKSYSEWLFDELYDAIAGLVPQEVRESLGSIFVELGRFFHPYDLHKSLEKRGLDSLIDGDRLSGILYESHWIGNFWKTEEGRHIYLFKSRSRSTGFTSYELCVLQLGLVRGLNMNISYKGYRTK